MRVSSVVQVNLGFLVKLWKFILLGIFLIVGTMLVIVEVQDRSLLSCSPCSNRTSVLKFMHEETTECIRKPEKLMLTSQCSGRLGNQMFSYATLYAIAKYNDREGYLTPDMSDQLKKYFKISFKTLNKDIFKDSDWQELRLNGTVQPGIRNITDPLVKLCCFPQTFKYFDEIRSDILEEFTFRDTIVKTAKLKLVKAKNEFPSTSGLNADQVTFVGVHVRRKDYIVESIRNRFHMPRSAYYEAAMKYFEDKHKNVVFIVASNGIPWCMKTFGNFTKQHRISYLNETSEENGALDMAVLSKCNHIIFGLGTFGFWAAYLSQGESIYCSDCITPNSIWLKHQQIYDGNYGNFVLPSWTGLSRNGSLISDYSGVVTTKDRCVFGVDENNQMTFDC